MLVEEAKRNLIDGILPFWINLVDSEYGGFYGEVDYNLNVDKKADKGTILVSRIMWLFSQAYIVLGDEKYLDTAKCAYEYFHKYCYDSEYGGLYWSTTYDGKPSDTVKHTYTMSYGIYGLVSYYEASGDVSVLNEAARLYRFIEDNCTDDLGYKEEFDRFFNLKDNEKVSDALASRGFYAPRTMNTLLHLLEAYTELYRAGKHSMTVAENDFNNYILGEIKDKVVSLLTTFVDKVYNKDKRRLEVFFDLDYNSLVDTQSYGHDIESAWLIDYAVKVLRDNLGEDEITDELKGLFNRIACMTDDLRGSVYSRALKTDHMISDVMEGTVNETRVWWVHAEAVNGFSKGYVEQPDHPEYKEAALKVLKYIKCYFIDARSGEWFNELDLNDKPVVKELAGPWKCPYHNGRMWLELIKAGN